MKRLMGAVTLIAFTVVAAGAVPAARAADKKADVVEREVRAVFDRWSTALSRGDKKTYLNSFWNSPRLIIRVANSEYRGLDAYRKRIEGAQMPPGSTVDYRNVQVVALGGDAAVVTYERPAPAAMSGGEPILFLGTLVFSRTPEGWKIAAWHAHSERGSGGPGGRSPH